MSAAEPPAKSKPTDYNLCIKCQEHIKKEKLTKPMVVSTYETFLQYVNERFETGNPDYIGVSQRLKGLSPNELLELGAQWRRNCETTDKNKLERDKKRWSLPGVLHSKKAGHEAIDIARTEKDIKGDLDQIFKSAKVIRQLVINARKECPWAFTGHLDGSSESGVPVELMMMTRWILQGSQVATTNSRNLVLRKSCANLTNYYARIKDQTTSYA
ncbi:Hypothetical predicted protein [Paramuricea clavata]|uniref:Uncharacterized protein n=1 Tax=Paramuricea clavata TaxID=317549 RepID=A0A6S7FSN3_PARCT|nr:Hypothetical predicted protein [Paramuricea clavata]